MIHKRYSKVIHERSSEIGWQLLLKKLTSNIPQKFICKRHSKISPQLFLKNWPTNTQKLTATVTQKVIHKCYTKIGPQVLLKKIDPQLLLKNWCSNITQKLACKRYKRIDSQTLIKSWLTNVTQKVTYKRYYKDNNACSWLLHQKLATRSNNLLILWFNNLCFVTSCRLLSL